MVAKLRTASLTAAIMAAAIGLVMITTASPAVGRDFSLHVPVLMYHRITRAPSDARLPELWVSPRRFRSQLAALKARGWRTITAEALAHKLQARRAVGPKRFVITIDDGALDGYSHAAPILEKLGMVATYCVTPGRAWKPWQLHFKHMRRLVEAGHEIANHSLTHADLPNLGPEALRNQVRRAARLIAERVGHAPVTFCYPYGHQNAAVRRIVGASGHFFGFTTVYGAQQDTTSRLRSPRIRVNGSEQPLGLVARLKPFATGGDAQGQTCLPSPGHGSRPGSDAWQHEPRASLASARGRGRPMPALRGRAISPVARVGAST